MIVTLIAAVARNGIIGSGDALPWRLPGDFAWFKASTLGKPMIMGRRTLAGIGKALPGRTTIALTSDPHFGMDGVIVAHSLDEALALAGEIGARDGVGETMVAGGAKVYAEAMPLADRLAITHVDLDPAGDAKFPPIDEREWMVIDEPSVPPSPKDDATFRVRVYGRRNPRNH